MAIARLYSRTTADIADGTKVDADYDNIINELNAHTAATNPHSNSLDKTGDAMSGALAITLGSNLNGLAITTQSTTTDVLTITSDYLTTGSLAVLSCNCADVGGRNLVEIIQDNAAAVLTTCLMLQQDATMTAGSGVLEIYNGASLNLYIPETGIVYGKGLII